MAFAQSPHRTYRTPTAEVEGPVLVRLEFEVHKRAAAHGETKYVPLETPLTGPVERALFNRAPRRHPGRRSTTVRKP